MKKYLLLKDKISIAFMPKLIPGLFFGLLPLTAFAQNTVAGWIGWLTGAVAGQPIVAIWYGLMTIIQAILSAILSVSAFYMNNIFYYAVILNPTNMDAVIQVWTYMRDLANAFFILIILWIAFTIIFNAEQYGGKQLLVRVIIVALLINFSLAFVGAVFGFANQIAFPFYEAITKSNGGDLAAIIINRTRVQLIFNAETESSIKTAGETLGVEGAKVDCGFGALVKNIPPELQKGCLGYSAAPKFAEGLLAGFTQGADALGLLSKALSLGISLIILVFVIAAFVGISYILLIRIVAMVFLAITAPAAFIAHIVPGGKLENLWNEWLQKLFCWAFIAPAFYFLFYTSMLILMIMTDTDVAKNTGTITMVGNLLQMIPFFIFFGFLWASITVGRRMGCTVAGEIALPWAKKAARAFTLGTLKTSAALVGGAASAGAGAAAGAGVGAAGGAGRITGALGKVSQRPILGKIAGPLTRRVGGYLESQKAKVGAAAKRSEALSPESIVTNIRSRSSLLSPHEIVGGAKRLVEIGKFGELNFAEQRNVLNLSRRFGLENIFLKARPDLTISETAKGEEFKNQTKTEIAKVIKTMSAEDIRQLDLANVGKDRTQEEQTTLREEIIREVFLTGDTDKIKELSKLLMKMPKEARATVRVSLETVTSDASTEGPWRTLREQDRGSYDRYLHYLRSQPGRELMADIKLPDFVQEDMQQLVPRKKRRPAGTEPLGGSVLPERVQRQTRVQPTPGAEFEARRIAGIERGGAEIAAESARIREELEATSQQRGGGARPQVPPAPSPFQPPPVAGGAPTTEENKYEAQKARIEEIIKARDEAVERARAASQRYGGRDVEGLYQDHAIGPVERMRLKRLYDERKKAIDAHYNEFKKLTELENELKKLK